MKSLEGFKWILRSWSASLLWLFLASSDVAKTWGSISSTEWASWRRLCALGWFSEVVSDFSEDLVHRPVRNSGWSTESNHWARVDSLSLASLAEVIIFLNERFVSGAVADSLSAAVAADSLVSEAGSLWLGFSSRRR